MLSIAVAASHSSVGGAASGIAVSVRIASIEGSAVSIGIAVVGASIAAVAGCVAAVSVAAGIICFSLRHSSAECCSDKSSRSKESFDHVVIKCLKT